MVRWIDEKGVLLPKKRCVCDTQVGKQIYPGMNETVGTVRQKNDGRWEWTQAVSRYSTCILANKARQGVVATLAEAMDKVEENYEGA